MSLKFVFSVHSKVTLVKISIISYKNGNISIPINLSSCESVVFDHDKTQFNSH